MDKLFAVSQVCKENLTKENWSSCIGRRGVFVEPVDSIKLVRRLGSEVIAFFCANGVERGLGNVASVVQCVLYLWIEWLGRQMWKNLYNAVNY